MIAIDGSYVYWSERDASGGAIRRVTVSGGKQETLVAPEQDVLWFVVRDGVVYYFAHQDLRARAPNGAVRVLGMRGDSSTSRLVLADDTLYWSTREAAIRRVSTTGGAVEEVVGDRGFVDFDAVRETVWWFTNSPGWPFSGPPALMRKEGFCEPKPMKYVGGHKLRACGDYLFWHDLHSQSMMRLSMAGGEPEKVADVKGVDDTACTKQWMYWTDATAEKVRRVPLSGGSAVDVFGVRTFSIAADEKSLYWLEDYSTGRSSVRRIMLE